MPFKIALGGTSVTVKSLPTVLSWPCVSGETNPPTRSGTAAYLGGNHAMPSINLGATAGSAAQWVAAPMYGPNNEMSTRLRCYVLCQDANVSQWVLSWDGTVNSVMGFTMDPAAGKAKLGTGINNTGWTVVGGAPFHWYFVTMLIDRSAMTFSVTIDGTTLIRPITQTTLDPASGLALTGVQGSIASLQLDYF